MARAAAQLCVREKGSVLARRGVHSCAQTAPLLQKLPAPIQGFLILLLLLLSFGRSPLATGLRRLGHHALVIALGVTASHDFGPLNLALSRATQACIVAVHHHGRAASCGLLVLVRTPLRRPFRLGAWPVALHCGQASFATVTLAFTAVSPLRMKRRAWRL